MTGARHSSEVFAWAAALLGMALALASITSMLISTPEIATKLTRDYGRSFQLTRVLVGVAAWLSLLLVASSLALIGEGVKSVRLQAGEALQWSLLGIGVI